MTTHSEILFISDLHLDQQRPAITEQFLSFLKIRASKARILYILGDLFEVWLGDDDKSGDFQPVFDALHHFSQSSELYFLHGNRDFLVGPQLAQHIGFTFIQDPCVIQLGTKRVGLMHGDLLCTDDVDYQKFRQMVRNVDWQRAFLAKPLTERQAIATQLREQSNQAMSGKADEIMDVNQQTVVDTFQQLKIDTLIHGHTHRPGIQQLSANQQRIVLGDWNPQPSYLSWANDKFTLMDKRV